jgi:AcrR family transcriptional regulator
MKPDKQVETQIKNIELVREKRLQIALSASKLFVKKGFFQTSVREIANATGLTIGNLYDYIRKKEDILYLVVDVWHAQWINRLRDEGVLEIDDPIKQLRTAIKKMLELVYETREIILLMYTESKLLPKDYLGITLKKESGVIEGFEKILRNGIKKKVFKIKDPFLLANIIVYLLSIEPLRGWNFRKKYKNEEVNNYIIDLILNSIISPKI